MPERRFWVEHELELVLYLYFQLPFGKLHSRQPDIVRLASMLGRTSSAVAMKLVNLASLDPAVTQSGRSGLGNASSLDRAVWVRFNSNWDENVKQAAIKFGDLSGTNESASEVRDDPIAYEMLTREGSTSRASTVEVRIGQQFFRNAVLANFDDACCITGLAARSVLVASHIRPWSSDRVNRLNPANGLCFSATMDRAFDAGLVCISRQMTFEVSDALKRHRDSKTASYFCSFDGAAIARPQKIALLDEALEWHRNGVYRGHGDDGNSL